MLGEILDVFGSWFPSQIASKFGKQQGTNSTVYDRKIDTIALKDGEIRQRIGVCHKEMEARCVTCVLESVPSDCTVSLVFGWSVCVLSIVEHIFV